MEEMEEMEKEEETDPGAYLPAERVENRAEQRRTEHGEELRLDYRPVPPLFSRVLRL